MDFFPLRCFIEIVRVGGFTRAADSLGRTQPAISAQIKKLEEELGGLLFDRSAPKLTLTDRGRRLYPRAVRLLDELTDMEREISSEDGRVGGRVSVAAGLAVIENSLPPVLGTFRSLHPLVRLTLLNRTGDGIYRALMDGHADMGIAWLLGGRERIVPEAIGSLSFHLAFKKSRKNASICSREQMLAGQVIGFEKGIDLRTYVESRLGPLTTSLELPSVESIIRYAERGFGPALIPIIDGIFPRATLEWLDLSDLVPPLTLELYTREGAVPSRAAALLMDIIRKNAGNDRV